MSFNLTQKHHGWHATLASVVQGSKWLTTPQCFQVTCARLIKLPHVLVPTVFKSGCDSGMDSHHYSHVFRGFATVACMQQKVFETTMTPTTRSTSGLVDRFGCRSGSNETIIRVCGCL